jgi:alpha-L-fucosidase 2
MTGQRLVRCRPKMRLTMAALLACGVSLFGACGQVDHASRKATARTSVDVDLRSYLADHDMLYSRVPERYQDTLILGNGVIGAAVYRESARRIVMLVSRSDVYSLSPAAYPHRKPIGKFVLETVGDIAVTPAEPLRIHIYDGVLTGAIATSAGRIDVTAFVEADNEVIVVKTAATGGERAVWRFEGDSNPQPTRSLRPSPYFLGPFKTPPPIEEDVGGMRLFRIAYQEPGIEGPAGTTTVGWRVKSDGPNSLLTATVAYDRNRGIDTRAAALGELRQFDQRGYERVLADHKLVWNGYSAARFVSIPDKKLESFYYIQFYKLRSATRRDGNPIDLQGVWLDPATPWPAMWHNLNSQLTYWIATTGNALDLAQPLIDSMVANQHRFAAMAGTAPNVYALHGTTTHDFIPPGPSDSTIKLFDDLPRDLKENYPAYEAFHRATYANFLWLTHDLWLVYRHGLDERLLREVIYPFLARGVNLYLGILEEDERGTLHLPLTYSPEYAYARDANYDLATLRWAAKTLVHLAQDVLHIDDPQLPQWQRIAERLVDYPYDAVEGFLIGEGVRLEEAHRHYSHLLMIYPFYDVNADRPGDVEKIERSARHWQHFSRSIREPHEKLVGYSFTGAASIYAAIGRGDLAYDYLDIFMDSYAAGRISRANTLYYEVDGTGTTFEVPLTAAVSVHDMLLQSWGDTIRIFPAIPNKWEDVSFAGLRAQGAFIVSAERRHGALALVRIKSLAGAPCRVRSSGIAKLADNNDARIVSLAGDLLELRLGAGEEIVLHLPDTDAAVRGVAGTVDSSVNHFGLKAN